MFINTEQTVYITTDTAIQTGAPSNAPKEKCRRTTPDRSPAGGSLLEFLGRKPDDRVPLPSFAEEQCRIECCLFCRRRYRTNP